MKDEDVLRCLQRRDRWIILTTVGNDGFPHSIPMGCFLVGDRIMLACKEGTQKVANLQRNPKVSLLWENGRGASDLIGILIRGHGRLIRDHDERLEIKREACRQRGEAPPQEVAEGFLYMEVTPVRTVVWNRPSARTKRRAPSEPPVHEE